MARAILRITFIVDHHDPDMSKIVFGIVPIEMWTLPTAIYGVSR
jgi:hypothetical protein